MQPAPLLTFHVFRATLEQAGCSCVVMATYGELADSDGTPTPALFLFERTNEAGNQRHAIVHVYEPTVPVSTAVVRSTCQALGLDTAIFGL